MSKKMSLFVVKKEKCVRCSRCMTVCPVGIISLNDNNIIINEGEEEKCIKCQHCVMSCPTSAISIEDIVTENAKLIDYSVLPKYENMDLLIRARRSVRFFKNENLSKDELNKLLISSLHAPTGVNKSNVLFTVISEKSKMREISRRIMEKLVLDSETNNLPLELNFFHGIATAWKEKNTDIVFRNAPHMIIASAPQDNRTPDADCIIALSYLDLLAPTLGVGTLWCGFAKYLITLIVPEILDELNIPEDHKIGYVMLLGKPVFRYKLTSQRSTNIHFID